MQEGSFFVAIQRQSAVSIWLPFRKLGGDANFTQRFDELSAKAEQICEKDVDVGVAATPLRFSFPGAFGLALQETHEAAGGVSLRKQPAVFGTKQASIVFQGYLSNLDELTESLLYGALPELGTSYEAEYGRGAFQLQSGGDQAQLSAEVVLHMYLRSRQDGANLPILLSEIQGQYAFVVYDNSKRQVFAARDPSGREPLYIKYEDDSTMAFTNAPAFDWGNRDASWQEVLPGHYFGGRYPKQAQQFALTPKELHMREYAASLEEMSPLRFRSTSLQASSPTKGEERDSSSARSSTELDGRVEQLFRISV